MQRTGFKPCVHVAVIHQFDASVSVCKQAALTARALFAPPGLLALVGGAGRLSPAAAGTGCGPRTRPDTTS